MLTPQLEKIKSFLEQNHFDLKDAKINYSELLEELEVLDKINLMSLYESLAVSKGSCPSCGRPF